MNYEMTVSRMTLLHSPTMLIRYFLEIEIDNLITVNALEEEITSFTLITAMKQIKKL